MQRNELGIWETIRTAERKPNQKKKAKQNMKDPLSDLRDNMKWVNLCTTGIPEGEVKIKVIQNIFEEMMYD